MPMEEIEKKSDSRDFFLSFFVNCNSTQVNTIEQFLQKNKFFYTLKNILDPLDNLAFYFPQ